MSLQSISTILSRCGMKETERTILAASFLLNPHNVTLTNYNRIIVIRLAFKMLRMTIYNIDKSSQIVLKVKVDDNFNGDESIESGEYSTVTSTLGGMVYKKFNTTHASCIMSEIRALVKLRDADNIVHLEAIGINIDYDIKGVFLERATRDLSCVEISNPTIYLYYSEQMISAVKYIHSIKIAHLDIKPHNMLMFGNTIKLCDFGFALFDEPINQMTYITRGSKLYSPPEILSGNKTIPTQVDLWSLGCTLVELYLGNGLFEYNDPQNITQLLNNIKRVITINSIVPGCYNEEECKHNLMSIIDLPKYVIDITVNMLKPLGLRTINQTNLCTFMIKTTYYVQSD